jgi:hypothetical protein
MNSNNIREFIESGILEAYVTNAVSDAEEQKVLFMKKMYPEVKEALDDLETGIEEMARSMAINPPPHLWNRIEGELNELIPFSDKKPAQKQYDTHRDYQQQTDKKPEFIEVESQSSHMRVHKNWKWVFAAVFILGKIFLAAAIYFYLENRQAQQNIQELKQQLKVERSIK